MDRLIEADSESFWRAADRWFPSVDNEAMASQIGERAIRDGRRDVLPAVLQRWAKSDPMIPDPERIECRVFEALTTPDEVIPSLWDRVGGFYERSSPTWREDIAAWTVLCRLESEAQRRAVLATDFSSATLFTELQIAADLLDVLPEDAEGVRWLQALWGTDGLRTPEAFRAVRDGLHPEAESGVALRHVAVLSNMPIERRTWGREQLRAALTARLVGANRVAREIPAGFEVDLAGLDEPALSWADLATALLVKDAMDDPAVTAAWFAQADADLRDTTSEYGGVLTWDQTGRLRAQAFAPNQRQGDRKFFSPPALIAAMYTGLAHYHFHAQAFENAEFAGPGRGDLFFTQSMNAHTLTLTFIDRDRLNVDFAFPGGWVLDLGGIDRPARAEPR